MSHNNLSPFCEAHGEYMKATGDLATSVAKLTVVTDWLVKIAGGLFMLGLALVASILVGIFQAGKLYEQVQHNTQMIQEHSIRYHTKDLRDGH